MVCFKKKVIKKCNRNTEKLNSLVFIRKRTEFTYVDQGNEEQVKISTAMSHIK